MMKKNNYLINHFSVLLLFSSVLFWSQTVVRYSQDIKGGATIIGNSWYYSTSNTGSPRITPDVDGGFGTTRSTSADLILPAGSIIDKAYLSIEKDDFTNDPPAFTSVKLKVPGAAAYTTLTSATSIANRTTLPSDWPTGQMIWDITAMMPAAGYVSTAAGGAAGRYFLADPLPAPYDMGGWSIIVVYKNPNSKFRNVTVADNWQYFTSTTISTIIPGIKVPPVGTVKAVVGVTGTYGDRGASDFLNFGKTATALTALKDPMTGAANDALNSSIAWGSNNNVLADGVAVPIGNYVRRNPISAGHLFGASESYDYDADIFDATGVLAPSATPISVTLQQQGTGNDILISGSYFISVDIAVPPKLTKTISPSVISDGGTAAYTWTVTNTSPDALLQTISFTDNLPSSIIVAAIPNASITGGSGGTITAAAGSGTVTIANLQLAPGQSATIKVDITNVPGQVNPVCTGQPAFTNSASNITVPASSPILDTSGMVPQCLMVLAYCYKPAVTAGTVLDTKSGITALGRAGAENGNWPMVRKGAWTALEAKTKGFVVNRIPTTAQVNTIAAPVEGMMVYDEEADCLKIYTTTDNGLTFSWQCFNTQTCP
ncbi:DUF7933 domain-containing protein [Chryseobacterium lathyri]|uniref:DUF7933 domain-containing protein n=1 Tax=Chryseobacterium lathyri TaxID=395933 RepID=A0A511YFV8_9FLAO|nr:DUF11 domain-containing protein [Chryseobacterium lathyri]GEN74046.1 hypothetical protein CLA01_41180 [Chryseobacterium lathyri]